MRHGSDWATQSAAVGRQVLVKERDVQEDVRISLLVGDSLSEWKSKEPENTEFWSNGACIVVRYAALQSSRFPSGPLHFTSSCNKVSPRGLKSRELDAYVPMPAYLTMEVYAYLKEEICKLLEI
jgi:hypothetical protein